MNAKFLVKLSNGVGIFAILLLVYWVFSFILIQVFGLKIFRAHMTESFLLSILGILALMGGALMLNIMFNLTRIAERNTQGPATQTKPKKVIFTLLALFPLIAATLFAGDYLSTQKKQQFLENSAEKILQDQKTTINQIANYQFTTTYIANTAQQLEFIKQLDSAFNRVEVIVPEQINASRVYLHFDEHGIRKRAAADDELDATQQALPHTVLNKSDYIQQTSLDDRNYLDQSFKNNLNTPRFTSKDGHYELFYPYQINGKTMIILNFSDYQRYGKFGS